MSEWTFITNHGAVLALIAQRDQITAREIAEIVGLTERPVRRIIAELETTGYLYKQRTGRVNRYRVNRDLPLRRPEARATAVGELLQILKLTCPVTPHGELSP
jgi:predicted ArsR family transcriptional regulator